MKPEIVRELPQPPSQCAVTKSVEGEFIDTKTWAGWTDPYIYLHVPYVKELARDLLGMVDADEVESLRAEVENLRERVEDFENLARAVEKVEALTTSSNGNGASS